LAEGAGWYDVDGEAGNGFVTVQVGGSGTIAGPPARGTMLEGSAPVMVANAAVKSRLVVVEVRIFSCTVQTILCDVPDASSCFGSASEVCRTAVLSSAQRENIYSRVVSCVANLLFRIRMPL
jgi:hypothetical protein